MGFHYRHPESYMVEREKVREHVRSVQATHPASLSEAAAAELGYDGLIAPPTYSASFGVIAETAMFNAAGVDLHTAQIVHVDQVVKTFQPLVVGMELFADVTVESLRKAHGTDVILIKLVITDPNGDVVQETYTTLAGRSGEEDGEAGFSDGTA